MNRSIIIAEAGVNHNGDFEIAKMLIKKAAEAKADYVKFQTFKASNLVTKNAKKASYQEKNINDGDGSQFEMLKKLEMPEEWHYELIKCANSYGIKFLSTGFDEESIDFLDKIGVDLFKIPSGEITNKRYLQHVARKGRPVIISTGMSNLEEVRSAINVLIESGITKDYISILHCNTEYPTPLTDVNLRAMITLQKEFSVKVGYSDHTLGIEVPIAAVALGATIVEKHFTIDKSLNGPDHLASLDPEELKEMVDRIRNIELAMSGNGDKLPSESEKKNINIIRKSLYYKHNIKENTILREDDLVALRPGDGVSPMEIDTIIGKTLKISVGELSQVKKEHLQ